MTEPSADGPRLPDGRELVVCLTSLLGTTQMLRRRLRRDGTIDMDKLEANLDAIESHGWTAHREALRLIEALKPQATS